jgi:hypothetical protein
MAVHGEGSANDPNYQDGFTNFWCIKSARAIGPDNGEVSLKSCSNPERDCYEEY